MKKKISLLALALAVFTFGLASAQDNLSGKDIARKVKDANKTKNGIIWAKLTVIENGKEIETRNIITKTFRKDNKTKAIFRFMNGLKRDVSFLTIEREENQNNIQYVYVPGVGRPRQIDSSEKQNDFEDTDFTNEDLGGRKIEDYNYERLKDATIKSGGESYDCYVIISTNKNPDVKYPKAKQWIDKKSLLPVQFKTYGKDGKVKREGIGAQIKEVKKGIFMPFFIYAKDVERKHETRMVTVNYKLDTADVQENIFTSANMNKAWKEK